jgi:hypothetical protein
MPQTKALEESKMDKGGAGSEWAIQYALSFLFHPDFVEVGTSKHLPPTQGREWGLL